MKNIIIFEVNVFKTNNKKDLYNLASFVTLTVRHYHTIDTDFPVTRFSLFTFN